VRFCLTSSNETLTAYAYASGATDSPVTAGVYTVLSGGSYPAFVTSGESFAETIARALGFSIDELKAVRNRRTSRPGVVK